MSAFRHLKALHNVSYFQAPPTAHIRPHRIPPGCELVELLLEGNVHFEHDGVDRERGPGDLFWHLAGEDTIHRNVPERPYRCMVFRFSVRGQPRRRAPRHACWANAAEARAFAWEAYHVFQGSGMDREALCACLYARLFWQVAGASAQRPDSAGARLVQRLTRFIESNIHADIRLADLADEAGRSVPHIHHLFRKHLGRTPHRFVLESRVRQACHLLSGTEYPVKRVGSECGFANVETFCRVFRKHTGATPTRYRESHDETP